MISKKYAPIVLLSTSLMAAIPAHADSSTTSKVGDVLAFAIPAAAYGSTYYMDDKEGRQQFYYSFATNVATTQVLKSVIDKERPNGRDEDSFPSGHTSMAFQGASFIHKRYGLEYSIPAYVGATFVGYSRIDADKHDTTDVLAGAALGVASSMFLTKSYHNDDLIISANLAPESYQVAMHYRF